MNFNNYQFLNEILTFARTITIKNDYFAKQVKEQYLENTNLEELDDIHNPYYLEICGEYISDDTFLNEKENKIEVYSMDTGEMIEFTKANLKIHKKTKLAYTLPNNNFFDLCNEYPDRVDLIKSIIYPVIEETLLPYTEETKKIMYELLKKENYTILKYDETLLYENEQDSMVDRLYDTVNIIKEKWDVKEFVYEEYYPHAMWSILHNGIIYSLLAQRIANLRTKAVHPIHLWEWLISKGLNDYRGYLTTQQELFLYRNLNYLLKNKGKTSTMGILDENLLGPYGIMLLGKSVMQDNDGSYIDCIHTPEIISEDIYTNHTPLEHISTVESMETIIKREYEDELEPDKSEWVIEEQENVLGSGKQTYLPTKLIELHRIPLYTRYRDMKYRMYLHTILDRIVNNHCDFDIYVDVPSTTYKLHFTVPEAIAMMMYCFRRTFMQKIKLTTKNIEQFYNQYIWYNGIIIKLTKENAKKYINKIVEIRCPVYIPDTAYLKQTTYEDIEPTYPDHFHYRGWNHRTDRYVDKQQIIDMFNQPDNVITSKDELTTYLHNNFSSLKLFMKQIRNLSDMLFNKILNYILKSINNTNKVNFELVNGCKKYTDWFGRYHDLNEVISIIDQKEDRYEVYDKFGQNILENIVDFKEPYELSLKEYGKLKELFIELCSYNVAFLNSHRLIYQYLTINSTGLRRVFIYESGGQCKMGWPDYKWSRTTHGKHPAKFKEELHHPKYIIVDNLYASKLNMSYRIGGTRKSIMSTKLRSYSPQDKRHDC